jgi:hypothetical protein
VADYLEMHFTLECVADYLEMDSKMTAAHVADNLEMRCYFYQAIGGNFL